MIVHKSLGIVSTVFTQHWNTTLSFRIIFYDAFKKSEILALSFFFIVILCMVDIKSLSDSLHLGPLIFSCKGFVIKFSHVHNEMDYSLPYHSHSWSFSSLSRSRLDWSILRLWRMLDHCGYFTCVLSDSISLSVFSF